jgi:TPP-dependent pyruvate/acetoin dehydrogenase alpha subunit
MTSTDTEAPSPETLARWRHFHQQMLRIREFEEAATRGMKEQLVLGAVHPSIGQEGVAVGVCARLQASDILLSTHRGHGHTLAKGAQALPMMLELFGREGGYCRGKGGSMHIADFSIGMLGANGVVGANMVIAVGAAHAIKLRKSAELVTCFFGDGAINRGPFLEGLNWAQVFGLPVLFVCEDNSYSATTRTHTMTAGEGASARATSLGIPTVKVDGNDVVAVDRATQRCVAEIREGGGPRFLHARTYRLTGHTAADLAGYRPKEEVEQNLPAEPIRRLEARLLAAGVSQSELTQAAGAARAEMAAAYDTAKAAPYPDAGIAFEDVQDIGNPCVEAF